MNKINYISSEMIKTESIYNVVVFTIAIILCLFIIVLLISMLPAKYSKIKGIFATIVVIVGYVFYIAILGCKVLDKPSGYYKYTVSMNEYFKLVNTNRIDDYTVIKQNKDGTFVITDDPSYRK